MNVKELIKELSKLPENKEVVIATLDVDFYNEDFSTFQKIEAVIPKIPKSIVKNSYSRIDLDNCAVISTHSHLYNH